MSWFKRRPTPSAPERKTAARALTTVLPSALPGLHFSAVLDVAWRIEEDAPPTAPIEVRVRAHVRHSAALVTRRCSVLATDQAEDEVLLALAGPTPVSGTPAASAWVVAVNLTTGPEEIAQAREHQAARRHELLRAHRMRIHTEALRAILSEPGLAHAWLFAQGRGDLNSEALKVIGTVSRLVAETGALPDIENNAHHQDTHDIALVLSRLTADERRMLIGKLPELVRIVGRDDIAATLDTDDRVHAETPVWPDR